MPNLRRISHFGSSPHTRGARLTRYLPKEADRIIPAYAGSTGPSASTRSSIGDHPRIRGEHAAWMPSIIIASGSSPHTRGARLWCRRRSRENWIIPAYAGSTGMTRRIFAATWDHPRIRGEHVQGVVELPPIGGSSPHTRGALAAAAAGAGAAGIIPAYAGSTAARRCSWPCSRDHPRIRGEHLNRIKQEMPGEGSSPHTRGAPSRAWPPHRPGGIIPAYAGSTRSPPSPTTSSWDHPRIRGEHVHIEAPRCPQMGSSPHTRGALRARRRRCVAGRDHPRIRGEH